MTGATDTTDAMDRACTILERAGRLPTLEEVQTHIRNAEICLQSVYTYPAQRCRAKRDLEVYTIILKMLQRVVSP